MSQTAYCPSCHRRSPASKFARVEFGDGVKTVCSNCAQWMCAASGRPWRRNAEPALPPAAEQPVLIATPPQRRQLSPAARQWLTSIAEDSNASSEMRAGAQQALAGRKRRRAK